MSRQSNRMIDDFIGSFGQKVHCKCGYPDMPGTCPGWQFCPMQETEEPECRCDTFEQFLCPDHE